MERQLGEDTSSKKFEKMEEAIQNISVVVDGIMKKAVMGVVGCVNK